MVETGVERARALQFDVPLAYYEWLAGIERDVRVQDLTPQEIVALIAALSTPAPKISEKRAREVLDTFRHETFPDREVRWYGRRTALDAMLALAGEATTINNRLSDIAGEADCNCAARYYGDDQTAHQLSCTALAKAAPQPAIPEGWQIVPTEPTGAMVNAAFEAHAASPNVFADMIDVWKSMLSASVPCRDEGRETGELIDGIDPRPIIDLPGIGPIPDPASGVAGDAPGDAPP